MRLSFSGRADCTGAILFSSGEDDSSTRSEVGVSTGRKLVRTSEEEKESTFNTMQKISGKLDVTKLFHMIYKRKWHA